MTFWWKYESGNLVNYRNFTKLLCKMNSCMYLCVCEINFIKTWQTYVQGNVFVPLLKTLLLVKMFMNPAQHLRELSPASRALPRWHLWPWCMFLYCGASHPPSPLHALAMRVGPLLLSSAAYCRSGCRGSISCSLLDHCRLSWSLRSSAERYRCILHDPKMIVWACYPCEVV